MAKKKTGATGGQGGKKPTRKSAAPKAQPAAKPEPPAAGAKAPAAPVSDGAESPPVQGYRPEL